MAAIAVLSPDLDFDRHYARLRSGHACIRCGCTVYRYCHFGLSFREEDTFLLCSPCQSLVEGDSHLPEVIDRLRRAPIARQAAFDRSPLPFSHRLAIPRFEFPGGVIMEDTPYPLLFGGKTVMAALPPEAPGGPFQLSVQLGREDGKLDVVIRQNEWVAADGDWRFRRIGSTHVISHVPGRSGLTFRVPGQDTILVSWLDSWSGGRHLRIDGDGARVGERPVALSRSKSQITGTML